MNKDARFYFANLGADVARCVSAAEKGNTERYEDSLERAHLTLDFLRNANRPEAYEEGLLLLRALEYAREGGTLSEFDDSLNELIAEYSPLVQWPTP